MQITFDTTAAQPAELAALSRFLHDIAALRGAPERVVAGVMKDPAATIAPADRPDTGRIPPPAPPAIVQAATQAAAAVNAPAVPDPAAVFAQAAQIPAAPANPAVPSAAPSVPLPPPLPQGVGAVHVPPPAPSLPTATAAPASAAPGGTEVDVRGLPWDGRIHTSTRAKNQDGSWRQRRGINDEAMVKRIEAELMAAMAARPASGAAPAVPQPPAADGTPTTFGAMMEAVSKLITDKRVTPDAVNAALMQHLGMPTMIGLGSRPDLIPQAWGIVQSLLVPA